MTNFGWSYPAGCGGTPYDDDNDRWVDDVLIELRKRNEGRNLNCWPVCSFGWKDADLDPEGCTGIGSVTCWDEDSITILVGGHKTLCPIEDGEDDTEMTDLDWQQQELVSGSAFDGEWTGDDWSLDFEETVRVEIPDEVWDDSDEAAISKIADLILDAAHEACKPFEDEMRSLSEAFDFLAKGADL